MNDALNRVPPSKQVYWRKRNGYRYREVGGTKKDKGLTYIHM